MTLKDFSKKAALSLPWLLGVSVQISLMGTVLAFSLAQMLVVAIVEPWARFLSGDNNLWQLTHECWDTMVIILNNLISEALDAVNLNGFTNKFNPSRKDDPQLISNMFFFKTLTSWLFVILLPAVMMLLFTTLSLPVLSAVGVYFFVAPYLSTGLLTMVEKSWPGDEWSEDFSAQSNIISLKGSHENLSELSRSSTPTYQHQINQINGRYPDPEPVTFRQNSLS